jgi:beta-barrel assembly-enhancing protease
MPVLWMNLSNVLRAPSSIAFVSLLSQADRSLQMIRVRCRAALLLALLVALVLPANAERTRLKPGWNLFSPRQDVEMGADVARDAESQLRLVNNAAATSYINALGRRLAAHAPGEKYPYQFKIVDDKVLNAFALPGGHVYINRGIIEAADTEAQLAGVIAHEISHIALRHSTNQVSKAYVAQAPLSILGGLLGSNSVGGVLAQMGAGFATNSVLLKYSRDAERQADLMGTQILYDSGYDTRGMVEFFEKLQAESKGRASEFFNSHPNPENRISGVQSEIVKLGGSPSNARQTSAEFRNLKRTVASLPTAGKRAGGRQRRN